MNEHNYFMQEAINEARNGMKLGYGGPFGSVVVKDGKIIGRSSNRVFETNDPTAHAEIMAIRNAAIAIGSAALSGCTIYSVGEPCPMCMAAIYWACIDKVYFANTKEDAASVGFDDSEIYKELALPYYKRTIPILYTPSEYAKQLFIEWDETIDKTDLPQT